MILRAQLLQTLLKSKVTKIKHLNKFLVLTSFRFTALAVIIHIFIGCSHGHPKNFSKSLEPNSISVILLATYNPIYKQENIPNDTTAWGNHECYSEFDDNHCIIERVRNLGLSQFTTTLNDFQLTLYNTFPIGPGISLGYKFGKFNLNSYFQTKQSYGLSVNYINSDHFNQAINIFTQPKFLVWEASNSSTSGFSPAFYHTVDIPIERLISFETSISIPKTPILINSEFAFNSEHLKISLSGGVYF